jgi:chromosome segregation ATPase
MNNTDRTARIKELSEERLEIIEEKNALTEQLLQVKAELTTVKPGPQGKRLLMDLHTRRSELVKEIDELNADIAEINTELKTLQGGNATWDLRNVLTLVAAYIAAGSSKPADELTREAITELELITRTIEETRP